LIEVKQDDYSLIKVPLEFVSSTLRTTIEEDEDARVSIEEYIRTFKLGNNKNKNKNKKELVFTMTESDKPAPVDRSNGSAVPALSPVLAGRQLLSSNASLFQ
jgi:hypothetical protein